MTPITPNQAIDMLEAAVAQLNATRAQHAQLIEAASVIRAVIKKSTETQKSNESAT